MINSLGCGRGLQAVRCMMCCMTQISRRIPAVLSFLAFCRISCRMLLSADRFLPSSGTCPSSMELLSVQWADSSGKQLACKIAQCMSTTLVDKTLSCSWQPFHDQTANDTSFLVSRCLLSRHLLAQLIAVMLLQGDVVLESAQLHDHPLPLDSLTDPCACAVSSICYFLTSTLTHLLLQSGRRCRI